MKNFLIILLTLTLIILVMDYLDLRSKVLTWQRLYNQAIQWQELQLPHKTKDERLLWKTKG